MAAALIEGILGRVLTFFGFVGASKGLAEPYLNVLEQDIWASEPSKVLDPQTNAQLAAQGIGARVELELDTARSGLNIDKFEALVQLASGPPSIDELYSLWRRGRIDNTDFAYGLRRLSIEERWQGPLEELKDERLSPQDLAMAYQQRFIDRVRMEEEGANSGFDAERMNILYEMSGLPPGIETGLEMWRRGIIAEGEFDQIVAEGHTKTKYTTQIAKLFRTLLTPQQAAMAVVKEHLTLAQGTEIAAQWGLTAEDFMTMYLTDGRPPGIMQALTLYNRGQMTREQFGKVVSQSDVRPEYAAQLFELRVHYPPLFQLVRLVTAGTISDALALKIMQLEGYSQELSAAIIAGAKAGKHAKTKDLTQATILELYEGELLDSGRARTMLGKLGYDDAEVAMLLELGAARRIKSTTDVAMRKIQLEYVNRRISEAQAANLLDQLGILSPGRDRLIRLWSVERDSIHKTLTEAQVVAAHKANVLSDSEATQRLIDMGYVPGDAAILLAISKATGRRTPATPPARP